MVNNGKRDFIVNSLRVNVKKPKKFWRIIKDLIDKDDNVDITAYVFRHKTTDDIIEKALVPDFFNEFFVNVASRTHTIPDDVNIYANCYDNIAAIFDFAPPTVEELYGYMNDIDTNMSSCVTGINSKVCKIMLDKIPVKFCHLFANSLYAAKFPSSWTNAIVTLLPKDGD